MHSLAFVTKFPTRLPETLCFLMHGQKTREIVQPDTITIKAGSKVRQTHKRTGMGLQLFFSSWVDFLRWTIFSVCCWLCCWQGVLRMSDVQVAERQSMYKLRLRPYGAVYNELTGEVCLTLASWLWELCNGQGNVSIKKCRQDICSKRWLQSCFSDTIIVTLACCSKMFVF